MAAKLIRIVTMTFTDDTVDDFVNLFDEVSGKIRSFPGCQHLQLLRDRDESCVFTTYSVWESAESLEHYRSSPLFRDTWNRTKRMFGDSPVARSYSVARSFTSLVPED